MNVRTCLRPMKNNIFNVNLQIRVITLPQRSTSLRTVPLYHDSTSGCQHLGLGGRELNLLYIFWFMLLVLHVVGLLNCLNKVRNFTMNAFQVQSRCPEAEFMTIQFLWGFWAYSWEFWELRFPYTFTMFHTTFAHKGGGVKSIRGGDGSKEENSEGLCPNYVQEFGLWSERQKERAEIGGLALPLSAEPVFVNL